MTRNQLTNTTKEKKLTPCKKKKVGGDLVRGLPDERGLQKPWAKGGIIGDMWLGLLGGKKYTDIGKPVRMDPVRGGGQKVRPEAVLGGLVGKKELILNFNNAHRRLGRGWGFSLTITKPLLRHERKERGWEKKKWAQRIQKKSQTQQTGLDAQTRGGQKSQREEEEEHKKRIISGKRGGARGLRKMRGTRRACERRRSWERDFR